MLRWCAVVVMLTACGARTGLESEREPEEPVDPVEPPKCLEDGEWSQVGDLVVPRVGPVLAAVKGGDAIIAGGFDDDPLDTVERFDSTTGSFSLIGNLIAPRSLFAAVTMRDGRVLMTGGYTGALDGSGAGVKFSEIVDPATNQLTVTADMPTGRYAHSMAALPSGRVLVVGGFQLDVSVQTAVVYDPKLITWEEVDAPPSVAGGYTQAITSDHGAWILASDGVYDFDGESFTKVDFGDYVPAFDVTVATRWRDGFASNQNDGNIWAFADGDLHWTRLWIQNPDLPTPTPSAVLPLCDAFLVLADKEYRLQFDPPPLASSYEERELREQHGITLDNGQLLIVGGRDEFGATSRRAEIFR